MLCRDRKNAFGWTECAGMENPSGIWFVKFAKSMKVKS